MICAELNLHNIRKPTPQKRKKYIKEIHNLFWTVAKTKRRLR